MIDLNDLQVDWNAIEESSFKPLEAGTYGGNVTGAKVTKTSKGDKMLKLEFTLLGAKGVKGRKIFENVMLTHNNPVVVNIGLQKLKTLATTIDRDIQEMESFSEFVGNTVGLKLAIEESEQYGAQNRIKAFLEFDEELIQGEESSSF